MTVNEEDFFEVKIDGSMKNSVLPEDDEARKDIPVYSGFIRYFPRAMVAVAKHSMASAGQHGQTKETMHWDRSRSGDELNSLVRHIIDEDWVNVAWRAMANLEKHLEKEEG